MAVKTKKVTKITKARKSVKVETLVVKNKLDPKKIRLILIFCVLLLLPVTFWYKTRSWPIAAVVNYMPITRFELNQMMYDKVGREALDALITQKLVAQEMRTRKISVSAKEIDAKLEEIKVQLGSDENFNQILELQGVTMQELRNQIEFQLKLEKLVPDSTDSAKMQEDISATLSALRSKAKVWKLGK